MLGTSKMNSKINYKKILEIKLAATNYYQVIAEIENQIIKKLGGFICVAAVHLITLAQSNLQLKKGLRLSIMTVPDGMPLVWLLRLNGQKKAQRIYGPNLLLKLCHLAQTKQYKVFLLGGKLGQSKILKKNLQKKFPKINIVGHSDTPIRPIPNLDNRIIIKQIQNSKSQMVFVGLGCPYQELWMINNHLKLKTQVLIGVGAAFDFISGQVKQAPPYIQNIGLEWLFRFIKEPRRLWRRYLITNTQFIFLLLIHTIKHLFNSQKN